jgi:hypothetical protein
MEASGGQGDVELQELLRRREQLAAEIAELHWDLGGLAYEMAIRDHIRPDVLLRRAAVLQERDTEMAEVERQLRVRAVPVDAVTPEQPVPAPASAVAPEQPAPTPAPARERRFPTSLGVWGLLALACLGFGAALGNSGTGSAAGRLTAARPGLRLVLPAPASASTASAPAPPAATATPTAGEAEASSSEEPAAGGTSEPPSKSTTNSSSSTGAGGGGAQSGKGNSKQAGGAAGQEGSARAKKPPPIKHVFLIVLDDEPYATVFGPSSPASYLTHTLEKKGELLVRYYAVAHEQLANGIALISGQGPTPQTASNCSTYAPIAPATAGAEQQVLGGGCVYPSTTETLAGQLAAKHLTWRAYVEGMDEAGAAGACAHPAVGASDPSSFDPGAGGADAPAVGPAAGASPYATFRNPFVYFQSVTGSAACAADDVGIDRLKGDLSDPAHTPSLSYIVPDLCDDGSSTPCAPGQPAGMQAADGFLKRVVPEILAAKAYKQNGLLAITVDEAPTTGEYADSSSCCEQPRFPNLPAPTGAAALSAEGGGEVGALLLSPDVKAGTTSQEAFNHYSLLRTIENLFGLSHLGYAANAKVGAFGPSVLAASGG